MSVARLGSHVCSAARLVVDFAITFVDESAITAERQCFCNRNFTRRLAITPTYCVIFALAASASNSSS